MTERAQHKFQFSRIVDMGMYFDGKCCVCRERIKSQGDPIWTRAEPAEGVKHTIAHARCVEEARPYLEAEEAPDA